MNKFTVRDLTVQVMVAAIYVTLTLAFWQLSFSVNIQFRLAEILLILVFFNKKHAYGILTGTFIANLFSPFGPIDALFGTLASLVAIVPMTFLKKRWYLAILLPVLSNALIIPMMAALLDSTLWQGYWVFAGYVALGELAVMVLLGIPFYFYTQKNKAFKELISK